MKPLTDAQVGAISATAAAQVVLANEVLTLRADNERLRAVVRQLLDADVEPTGEFMRSIAEEKARRLVKPSS